MVIKYLVEIRCLDCGRSFWRRKRSSARSDRCSRCSRLRNAAIHRAKWALVDQSGQRSPHWKGGHKYWQAGKLGRDKDGLSWKAQRQLCWERDGFTCQHCGTTREQLGRKPDCHHVSPYRISFSHALPNLVSLCRSCHKKAEARIKELWGGVTLRPVYRRPKKVALCSSCGASKQKKYLFGGECGNCVRAKKIEVARGLYEKGVPIVRIAETVGVTDPAIHYWKSKGWVVLFKRSV